MLVGVAFGTVLLASAPAIIALFALPITWTRRRLAVLLRRRRPVAGHPPRPRPLHHEVLSATQWAHAGTALALWMLLPLLIGIWRITRQEVAA
jgi:ABC-2 type transport system permease protein